MAQITTYSSRNKPIGTKHRNDKSVPGQRCITYSNVEETTTTNKINKKEGK